MMKMNQTSYFNIKPSFLIFMRGEKKKKKTAINKICAVNIKVPKV